MPQPSHSKSKCKFWYGLTFPSPSLHDCRRRSQRRELPLDTKLYNWVLVHNPWITTVESDQCETQTDSNEQSGDIVHRNQGRVARDEWHHEHISVQRYFCRRILGLIRRIYFDCHLYHCRLLLEPKRYQSCPLDIGSMTAQFRSLERTDSCTKSTGLQAIHHSDSTTQQS